MINRLKLYDFIDFTKRSAMESESGLRLGSLNGVTTEHAWVLRNFHWVSADINCCLMWSSSNFSAMEIAVFPFRVT